MKTNKNNSSNGTDKKNIRKAIKKLNEKGVVIFPTDTVYGIGALPYKEPVRRIYEIKKRDFSKKIIALVDNHDRIRTLIDEKQENIEKITKILEKYWPGELTVIFKANKDFVKHFDKEMETIGIRIPKNETALEIIRNVGGTVLTTSAKIAGEKGAVKIEDINKEILQKVDAVVKDEKKMTGVASTIVKYENGDFSLLREGNVSLEEIKRLID